MPLKDFLKNNRKNLKVLFLPSATKIVAATRYRIYEYLPFLEKEGIIYKVYPINSDFISRLSIRSSDFKQLFRMAYYSMLVAERIIRAVPIIFLAFRYEVIFIQRATFLFGFERLLKAVNKNIIFDFDDAIFISDNRGNGLIDRLKGWVQNRSVARILKISKYAIVENDYIKKYALGFCPNVEIITGPINTERNLPKNIERNNAETIIGWIGSPSTTPYLRLLDNIFKEISAKYPVIVKLIGASKFELTGVKVVVKDWESDTEVEDLQSFDIGVMPMSDNEWTRGKVSIKLLQYMSVGIPVVCSPVGAHAQIIQDGVNGFLAYSDSEWIEKLSLLIKNPDLRKRLGDNGRFTVEKRFSVKVNAPRLLSVLKKVYEDRRFG